VYPGKVALPGRMLAMGSIVAVAVHSTGSPAAVVIASEIEGAAFALASEASSSMVA
jgi:hypothetical protein